IFLINVMDEFARRSYENVLGCRLSGGGRCAGADVQASIRARTEVNALRQRVSRHCRVHKSADVPAINTADQFVVVASDELDGIFVATCHGRNPMRGKTGGIDEHASLEVSI